MVVGVGDFITGAGTVQNADKDGRDNSATLQLLVQYGLQGSPGYDLVKLPAQFWSSPSCIACIRREDKAAVPVESGC